MKVLSPRRLWHVAPRSRSYRAGSMSSTAPVCFSADDLDALVTKGVDLWLTTFQRSIDRGDQVEAASQLADAVSR